jgi:hypothetical protein
MPFRQWRELSLALSEYHIHPILHIWEHECCFYIHLIHLAFEMGHLSNKPQYSEKLYHKSEAILVI